MAFKVFLVMTSEMFKNELQTRLKCFKLLSALEKSFNGLNFFMFYIELCIELSVVRSMIYQVSIIFTRPNCV